MNDAENIIAWLIYSTAFETMPNIYMSMTQWLNQCAQVDQGNAIMTDPDARRARVAAKAICNRFVMHDLGAAAERNMMEEGTADAAKDKAAGGLTSL